MAEDKTPEIQEVAAGSVPTTQTKLSARELAGSKNPALARLANQVNERESSEAVSNYSRMHHRHNRS